MNRSNLQILGMLLLVGIILMGANECELGSSGDGDSDADIEDCINGLDDDGDGATDCDDGDCEGDAGCRAGLDVEICGDRVDNDGDGRIDCNDTDCAGDSSCSPEGTEGICDDRVDGDGDGAVDCFDSDCDGDPACVACGDAELCDNGVDDDCDGAVDCDDPECTRELPCYEIDPPTDCNVVEQDCGAGQRCYPGGVNASDGRCDRAGGRGLGEPCVGLPIDGDEACGAGLICATIAEDCDDGYDNDGDGFVDWEDCECTCTPCFECWACGDPNGLECWDICEPCDGSLDDFCQDCRLDMEDAEPTCVEICGPDTCPDGFECSTVFLGDESTVDWGVCSPDIPGEICDDSLDNDGDGLTDCDDGDCLTETVCIPCDFFSQDCADPTKMCVLRDLSTRNECIPEGSGTDGSFCGAAADCSEGLQCAAMTGYPHDSTPATFTIDESYISRGGQCSPLCFDGDNSMCPTGYDCGLLYRFGSPGIVGVCYDPNLV